MLYPIEFGLDVRKKDVRRPLLREDRFFDLSDSKVKEVYLAVVQRRDFSLLDTQN